MSSQKVQRRVEWPKPRVAIIGGGLCGMLLAIGLEKKLGKSIQLVVYEQAPSFSDDVGGAIGMYPNGFKVIRDIDPELLQAIRKQGVPYEFRRWMKPDGTVIAEASERSLCEWDSEKDEAERSSIGIRRWRLQKVFLEYALKLGIQVHFDCILDSVENIGSVGPMTLIFKNGRIEVADLVFGCDGAKSVVRASMMGRGPEVEPQYTGVTVLMGAADVPAARTGICFPASPASGFHAVYYPTSPTEQVFQVFFSVEERPETWRPLSAEEGAQECNQLADRMAKDGWHEQFLQPLRKAKSVIRVGLRARDPISQPCKSRVILVGDSWHAPVPYLGQGFMAGVEDVGTLLQLLQRICLQPDGRFEFSYFDLVLGLYQKIRIPRTTTLYRNSSSLGVSQRARSQKVNRSDLAADEWNLWLQIKRFGTLPSLKEGSGYDYNGEVEYWMSKIEPDDTEPPRARL